MEKFATCCDGAGTSCAAAREVLAAVSKLTSVKACAWPVRVAASGTLLLALALLAEVVSALAGAVVSLGRALVTELGGFAGDRDAVEFRAVAQH